MQTNNSSGYKGVSWHKRGEKWVSRIKHNSHHHHLGRFTDPIEAARAYDAAARRLHGDFARLNFPD